MLCSCFVDSTKLEQIKNNPERKYRACNDGEMRALLKPLPEVLASKSRSATDVLPVTSW
jgi:hypothetical protein